MSWLITFIGHPEKIAVALEKHSESLDGQSKAEFDAALPHMVGLVKQNYNPDHEPVLKITASGHGYNRYNTCTVSIEHIGGTVV